MSAAKQTVGQWLELAGAGVFLTGFVLSVHHYAIGICLVAGAVAFYTGKKLRAA